MQDSYPVGAPAPAPSHPLTGVTAFTLKRRICPQEQYYEVRPLGPGGAEADVVLYASPKQLSLPEEYRFSTDRQHTWRWLTLRARTHLNLFNAVYDAFDERGAPIGLIQYQWLISQVLHTWRVVGPGVDAVGHQKNAAVGVARLKFSRLPFATLFPVPYAFDVEFRDSTGRVLLRSERRAEMRDRYTVTMPDGRIDGRLAAAMALLLDWKGMA